VRAKHWIVSRGLRSSAEALPRMEPSDFGCRRRPAGEAFEGKSRCRLAGTPRAGHPADSAAGDPSPSLVGSRVLFSLRSEEHGTFLLHGWMW